MDNKQFEIRTPLLGVRVGNRGTVDGKAVLHVKQGGTEDYIHAHDLLEAIYGVAVKKIEFHNGMEANLMGAE